MPSFSFEVEYAKSNRAGCKKCKDKIEKDTIRVGFKQDVPEDAEGAVAHMGCAWHHFGCFSTAKGAAWFKKHLLPEGDENVTGIDALKPEDRELVLKLFKACRGEAPVPEARAVEGAAAQVGTTTPKGKKRKAAAEEGSVEKRVKTLTDEQLVLISQAKENLKGKNVAYLGAALSKNGLPKAGSKDLLLDRIAEAKVLGVPPTCPRCDKKKLTWSRETGKFSCPGYFDDESKSFKRCKGPEEGTAIERTAWEDIA